MSMTGLEVEEPFDPSDPRAAHYPYWSTCGGRTTPDGPLPEFIADKLSLTPLFPETVLRR